MRLPVCVAVCLVASGGVAGAQGNSQNQAATSSAATSGITGRVTDAVTGEPISGVVVHLRPLRSRAGGLIGDSTFTSQNDGSFHFDSLTAGTYLLRGERAGYLSSARFTRGQTLQVGTGQLLNDASLKMMPESKLDGRVYDDAGRPVAGAHVRALAKTISAGRVQLLEKSNGDTDTNGFFSLGKLQPGKYVVIADPPQKTSQQEGPNGDLVTTLFPQALTVDEAEEVEVAAGYSPSDLKIYLQRAAAHHIRGRIPEALLHPGHPNLLLAPRSSDTAVALTRQIGIAKDGSFDAGGVIPGVYVLRLTSDHHVGMLARAEVEVGAGDVNDVALTSLPPVLISGAVRMDGGDLPAQTSVRVFARALTYEFSGVSLTDTRPDGTFQLGGLNPDEYIFRAVPRMSGVYVETILFNGQDVFAKAVDLADMGSGRMDIVLHSGPGTISGTVTTPPDDNPTGVSIVVVPNEVDPAGSNIQFFSTGNSGTFHAGNLRPGDYTLYALHSADQDVWLNTAFLRQIAPQGTPVTVTEGQQQQIQLNLLSYDLIAEAALEAGIPND